MIAERLTTTGRDIHLPPSLSADPATLAELFVNAAVDFDLEDALSYKVDDAWVSISSRQMIERAEHIALGLFALGLGKGDRTAILAANSPHWTLADAGCQFVGIIDVPVYTTLTGASVRYILNDSMARVLFVQDREMFGRIAGEIAACSSLEHVVFFDAAGVDDSRAISLEHLEELGRDTAASEPDLAEKLRAAVEPGDVATLIYTSGTTGEPKGVMLTHRNLVSNVLDASEKYEFSREDVSLSVLPLSHVFERTGMYVYIRHGMRVHYAESIEKVPDNLREVKPTIFIGVPRIFEKVFERARFKATQAGRVNEMIFDWATEIALEYARHLEAAEPISIALTAKHGIADKIVFAKLRDFFGGRLRYCITGGAALSDEIYLIFTGAGISIMQGYGLTETSPVISSNNPKAVRVGTVGQPIRNVSVRTADDGEIEVRGPGVMTGYYNKPEATREVFTDDGWFRTGDIGRIDDDGFLIISDRKKELFKTSGGKYIAPAHIEQMLCASRFISQAVLVGNERRFPAALIVPNFEMLESYARHKEFEVSGPEEFCSDPRIIDLIGRQIEAHTRDLAQFEKVKKFALLARELTVEKGELTPTLKIKRRVVDENHRAIIEELYA